MTTPRRVLLVDDDTPLRESLKEQLDLQGEFIVADAATGAAGLEKAKHTADEKIAFQKVVLFQEGKDDHVWPDTFRGGKAFDG